MRLPRTPLSSPPFVRQILKRALARSADARFGTALDMQHALYAAMAVMAPLPTRAGVAALLRDHLQEHMNRRRHLVEDSLGAVVERSENRRRGWSTEGDCDSDVRPVASCGDGCIGLRSANRLQ